MAKHNKKRNVGLLHEQLVRHASEMTVEGKTDKSEQVIKILVEFFNKDSELLKEFRLFSALAHPRVRDKEIARRIIEESRRACANHDPVKLNREKSRLIKEINHRIDRDDFYNQRIENYKIFSTIQALLNEWRGKNFLRPEEVVKYELFLERYLTRDAEFSSLDKKENANPLVLNIMIEKFNKKYGKNLNEHQANLLQAKLKGDDDTVEAKTRLLKLEAMKVVKDFYDKCENDVLKSKQEFLEERIDDYVPGSSDDAVSKALQLSNLIQELGEKDV